MKFPGFILYYNNLKIMSNKLFLKLRSSLISVALIIMFSYVAISQNNHQQMSSTSSVNIVLRGNYADPTIIRDGKDYYMTHSSFDYYPGLLIWHSTDLKNWTPIARALTKNVGNVWAPDMVKYKGKYYIYFPANGIYVVTADKPEGPWSEPIKVSDNGIDPGHIVTPEGKRYLYKDGGRYKELTDDGLTAIGEYQKGYDGWQYPDNFAVQCFCLESPKLIYRNRYFYLTSAEGGTAGPTTSHMVVSARSKSPIGPWENSPYNPIVHTWKSSETWMSKGHGTIFDDEKDNWYILYHGFEKGQLPLGRASMIEPIKWTPDGWFKTALKDTAKINYTIINNGQIKSDDFSGDKLNLQWSFKGLKTLDEYSLGNGKLILNAIPEAQRVIVANITDNNFEASARIDAENGTQVGLTVHYNDKYFSGIAFEDGKVYSVINGKSKGRKINAPDCKYFKIKLVSNDLTVYYSNDGKNWTMYPEAYEVSGYFHNILGDWRSVKIGMYCVGTGKMTVDDFVYHGII
jgi:xylan 1,4-beta-xylosidase